MNVVGMIVEYNPFHNGHLWHVAEARRLAGTTSTIGVMSGQFVQRGEPALFDKWVRAEMAVRSGVDLILELPAVYAVRSAQYFATGGVRLLEKLGLVTHLCFGAEHANLNDLQQFAAVLDDDATHQQLKHHLKTGVSYASALESAAAHLCGATASLLRHPNNILAVEYLRALHRYAPTLAPLVIPRRIAGHNDREITTEFSSASAIRNAILTERFHIAQTALPPASIQLIASGLKQGRGPLNWDVFSAMVLGRLRSLSPEQLALVPEISEGLEHKISRAALLATNIDDLLARVKSKRYPFTRLQRILVHVLLGTTQEELGAFDQMAPPYARVLAFNQNGRRLLHCLRQKSTIPIITKTAQYLKSRDRFTTPAAAWQRMLALDTLASDIYALGMPQPEQRTGGWDFYRSPVYTEE